MSAEHVVVVITGTSEGIGRATAKYFLDKDFEVHGLDIQKAPKLEPWLKRNYHHHICDVSKKDELPDIPNVDILVNNAGVQEGSIRDIEVNLIGLINCTEKYGIQPAIQSIMNVASVSAHNGAEYPEYCASKGGMLAYTVNTAKRIAQYGATCNSISPGGVYTDMNKTVIEDEDKWNKIMSMTPMKKWATAEEIAEWVYFFTVHNRSCTAQDLIIDNGESFNHTFVE